MWRYRKAKRVGLFKIMYAMNWYLTVLKKYVQFSGRARRSEYWYFVLFSSIVSMILAGVDFAMGTRTAGGFGGGTLGSIYSVAVLLPSIAVGVRRMHDVGKSGWFILIPIYNLILACTDGEKGTNQYGPDPKNPDADGIVTDAAILDGNI